MKAFPRPLKNAAANGILKLQPPDSSLGGFFGKDVFWLLFQKFQQFMYGRYGGDKFSLFLLAAALVISLIGAFFWPISLIADAIFLYVLFRMFSRNHAARQREYYGFLRFWTPVEEWFRFQRTRFRERNTYKYFRCPQCKQRLRAPRGKGKIQVTCQKCRNVFQTKT